MRDSASAGQWRCEGVYVGSCHRLKKFYWTRGVLNAATWPHPIPTLLHARYCITYMWVIISLSVVEEEHG